MDDAITYQTDLNDIDESMLSGFFVGWPDPPDAATHLRILQGSSYVALAVSRESKQVVGFANAVSDGVFMAFIPLLEVLPAYGGRGIGSTLVRALMKQLEDHYAIDAVCDPDVIPFYKSLDFVNTNAMSKRHYHNQNGR